MIPLIILIAAGAGILIAHVKARQYTRSRLRFVEAVQTPVAPVIAGLAAATIAAPLVWLLPVVGAGTAVLFGVGIGTGVAMGAKDVKRLPGA